VACRSSTPRAIQPLLLPLRTDGGARATARETGAELPHATTVVAVPTSARRHGRGPSSHRVLHSQSRHSQDRTRRLLHRARHFGYRREGHRVHPMPALLRALREDDRLGAQPEGKANYLSPIIQRNNSRRSHVSLCCRLDLSHRVGRIFEYDGAVAATNEWTSPRSARDRPSPRAPCGWLSRDLDLEGALDLGALPSTKPRQRSGTPSDFSGSLFP